MKYYTGLTVRKVKQAIAYHKQRLNVWRDTIATYENDYDSSATLLVLKARYKEYYHELAIEECEQVINYIKSLKTNEKVH